MERGEGRGYREKAVETNRRESFDPNGTVGVVGVGDREKMGNETRP